MSKEFVCVQDRREEELKKEGYVAPEKAYFRIGRAIFTVDTMKKDYSLKEAVETPLGLVMDMNRNEALQKEESLKMLQEIFGSTGYLRIICEGDPDCGFAGNDEVLLTGYRGGLDDVIVDRMLLQTVHGSSEDIMRNFSKWLNWHSDWLHVPNWETYDGSCYRVIKDKKIQRKVKRLAKRIKDIAYELEHLDDMPDWVKEKFKEQTQ